MNRRSLFLLAGFYSVLFSCRNPSADSDLRAGADSLFSGEKFSVHIRTTEARSPEEERKGFKLPEGFEISLYASEPDIGKPINIAFDGKGRMWVTQSFEYPFAATPGKGKDRITILEDTDGDGKADKFTHFDDTLNIPIGILPVNDGAIAYSIPNVYRYTDKDNDGKADEQKKFLGPFEFKDTHGMVNNFIRGYDGWVHACHGYTNRSTVAGADGDSIQMISGNTFRFKPDGSRAEHGTYGRINPFGLAFDERGYLYSTDCHTSPLYQLIKGGDYYQWGKEEDMGFAPDMKPLEDEATALCGIAYYADVKFPQAYQRNFYIGDAVSSRVYRNSYTFRGSSPVGKKEENFILSEDPWFRPVDIKPGPDGALYIADFYNSIIGHYEVPLDHPKRDRVRGRIWRVTYKGQTNKSTDWRKADVNRLLEAFRHDNLVVRMQSADQLADRIGSAAVQPLTELLSRETISTREYIHALWVLQRLNAITPAMLTKAAAHKDAVVRLHTLRILAERGETHDTVRTIAEKSLQDNDPHVQRAAVELLMLFPGISTVEQLVEFRKRVPDDDSHLIYTIRLALRTILRKEPVMQAVFKKSWNEKDANVLSTVLIGVQTEESGKLMYDYLKKRTITGHEMQKAFTHVVRFVPSAAVSEVVEEGRIQGSKDIDTEYAVYMALQKGLSQRGMKEGEGMQRWGRQLAMNLLSLVRPTDEKLLDHYRAQQNFATRLAGDLKINDLQPKLLQILEDSIPTDGQKAAAFRSLLKMDFNKHSPLTHSLLQNTKTSPALRRSIVSILGEFPGSKTNEILGNIRNPSPDLQHVIVMALASSADGREIVFSKVRKGEIFARTLVQPVVEERLTLNINPKQRAVYKELTSNLTEVNREKQSMITGRISDFNNANPAPDPAVGRTVFVRNCALCHSINNEGGMIGPQLNSVGKWGVNALAEKILDPNRNISESFRTYTITLKDGKVMSGLFRREEGETLVFADAGGREFSLPKAGIKERAASKFTLMPDQFENIIPQDEFNALLAYLLTVKN